MLLLRRTTPSLTATGDIAVDCEAGVEGGRTKPRRPEGAAGLRTRQDVIAAVGAGVRFREVSTWSTMP